MSREFIENVMLFLLTSFLIGVMVAAGCLVVVHASDFARFLFTVWYVLTV